MHAVVIILTYAQSNSGENLLNIAGKMIMQVHIAQRGAITPLIKMLESSDEQVMEMSAFALGRLAQVLIFLN